jgi:Holliday junction resolvase
MGNYSKGAKFEREIIKDLEKRDMYCIRSAGSKGIVDVIAMKRYCGVTFVYLIQCKYGKATMNKKDQKKLKDLANKLGFIPVYIYRKKYSKETKLINL